MSEIKIALAQINPKLGDLNYNLEKHKEFILDAKTNEADLIIFPEKSLTGSYLKDLTYEVALKEDSSFLLDLYELSQDIGILFGFVEESKNFEYFSSSLLLFNKKIFFKHRKVFLPSNIFNEKIFLKEGNTLEKAEFLSFNLGPIFSEEAKHIVSYLNLLYSDIIIVQADLPYRKDIENFYLNLGKVISTLLGSYFIFVNRVGFEDGIYFWGNSFAYSPKGELLLILSEKEEISYINLNKEEIKEARISLPLIKEWDRYFNLFPTK